MKPNNTECEVCGSRDLKRIGKRAYKCPDMRQLDPYNAKRFTVLFTKWFPGRLEIELSSILCSNCGFIVYEPRPERKDVEAKYRLLQELGQDYGQKPAGSPIEMRRAEVLYIYLTKRIDLGLVSDVLDYGGGDGRLMQTFLKAGKHCFTIDYNRNCIPGITKLGDTLESLHPNRQFDLVVCSHVIEHVAEPLSVIRGLSQHLKPKGWMYVEVPMEVWKRAPLQPEPVTHINFFTPNSLRNLLLLAGLDVRESRLAAYLHPSGNWSHAVRALAGPGEAKSRRPEPLTSPEAEQFMRPNIVTYSRYIYANPRALLHSMKHRLR